MSQSSRDQQKGLDVAVGPEVAAVDDSLSRFDDCTFVCLSGVADTVIAKTLVPQKLLFQPKNVLCSPWVLLLCSFVFPF